jgi:hypothetical protein
MVTFNVKVSLEVPDEKKPEKVNVVSFDSTVYDIDKRIVNQKGEQVLQTMFLVYGKETGFVWVSAASCNPIPLTKSK